MKHGKKYRETLKKYDRASFYSLKEALDLVKSLAFAKFDETVDLSVKLNLKKSQSVRDTVVLPHQFKGEKRVLVFCKPEKEKEAQIKGGWTDVDVIITMPSIMGKIGALGRVLGPRGLMPNPKSGTVTNDVAKAVKEVKQGKIDFKVDKTGICHTSVGKVSFSPVQIYENAKEFVNMLIKLKPTTAKGLYVRSIYLSSTMSPGIKIDPKSVNEI